MRDLNERITANMVRVAGLAALLASIAIYDYIGNALAQPTPQESARPCTNGSDRERLDCIVRLHVAAQARIKQLEDRLKNFRLRAHGLTGTCLQSAGNHQATSASVCTNNAAQRWELIDPEK